MNDKLFRLDGKVAVVTGAGNGLGRSFALGLSAFGATVICADKNLAGADETASLAKQSRGKAEAMPVDVTDETSVDDLWKRIADEFPRIDILINNAGINTNTPRTHEYSIADWDRVMAVNLRGVFMTTRKALALMLPGPGSIINVSSIMGLRGGKDQGQCDRARLAWRHCAGRRAARRGRPRGRQAVRGSAQRAHSDEAPRRAGRSGRARGLSRERRLPLRYRTGDRP
jgi:NAD(P)-dependent dehydrogenase (short-subunit alcohol dehydrogenase family)